MERFREVRPVLIHVLPGKSILSEEEQSPLSSKKCLGLITFQSTSDLDLVYKVFKRNNRMITDEHSKPFKIGIAYDWRQV